VPSAGFLGRYDILQNLAPGGTFLLNVPWPAQDVWKLMPPQLKQQLIEKQANFYVIDANAVAQSSGMGRRINTVMQVCFFALSGVLPREQAIEAIKDSIRRTYGKKGDEIIARNLQAVDNALAHLNKVEVPANRVLVEATAESARVVGGTTSAGMAEGIGRGVVADGTIGKHIAQGEEKDVQNGIVLPPALCTGCTSFVRDVLGAIIVGRVRNCQSVRCRATALSPRERRSMKSAIWPRNFPYGIWTFASSVASARWCVHTA
jgi:pyruvate-ferredoxin/flavodoxin oxidoreductase